MSQTKQGPDPKKEQAEKEVKEVQDKSSGTIITSQVSSSASDPDDLVDRSLVNVKITYPKDFKSKRHFHDGQVYPMSRETANQIVDLGIGKEC